MTLATIYLDPGDDFVSIRDRLSWAAATRAVLILPDLDDPLLNSTDLALLRRLADRERIRIGIVTGDARTRRLAREFGVPAFSSSAAARRGIGWGARPRARIGFAPGADRLPPGSKVAVRPTAGRRVLNMLLLLALVAAAVALVAWTVPRATIAVRPATTPISTRQYIRVNPAASEPDLDAMSVPGRALDVAQTWEVVGTGGTEALGRRALAGLEAAAPGLLAPSVRPGEQLVPGSVTVMLGEQAVEELADGQTRLRLPATVSATVIDEAAVNWLAYRALSARVPQGTAVKAETLTVDIGTIDPATSSFAIEAAAESASTLDATALAALVRGQTAADAIDLLAAQPGLAGEPSVSLSPAWWARWIGRLPWNVDRITIEQGD